VEFDILNYFSEEKIAEDARNSGFVVRKSPIDGFKFLLTFTTGFLSVPDATLNQLTAFLSHACGTDVTPQAFDERIEETGREFLRLCLEKALQFSAKRLKLEASCIKWLDHIYIIDSTNFDIHPSLQGTFKGSGGSASKASVRIQFVFDYLSGRTYVQIGDADTADATTLHDIIEKNKLNVSGSVLFLFDLGYFRTATFSLMGKKRGQYFLSKLKYGMKIYDTEGREIKLLDIIRQRPERIDFRIRIGEIECRLTGMRLPDNIVNEKLRKANSDAVKKGRSISEDYRMFLSYGLFLTNMPDDCNFNVLFTLYRIRWQIELIFKTWKSILNIHRIRSAREDRVLCEVYGKLIIASLTCCLSHIIQTRHSCILSFHKVLKHIKSSVAWWAQNIVKGKAEHAIFIERLIGELLKYCRKNKQKNKPTIEFMLNNLNSPIKNA
jgi:hypothetical protein